MTTTRGPLDGLRVLDLSTTAAGAQSSMTLADFGAEVVHVEPPGGSPLRESPGYPFLARGKKSIVLDLHDAADVAVARDLAVGADVLIETFRPGVIDRIGLGYDALQPANPRLVFGSVTGWGRTGPYAGAKGYEPLVLARIGALATSSAMVARSGPAHVSVPFASYGASQLLLTGILAALHERESSGLGQRVDTSLVKGVAALGTWNWYLHVVTKKWPDAFTQSAPVSDTGVPLSPLFFMLLIALSKDGRWMQFSQVQPHLYLAMLAAMGLDDLVADDEWKLAVWAQDPDRNLAFWDKLVEAAGQRTLAEWQSYFEDHHDVWAETMRRGSELLDHPQLQHMAAVVTLDDVERGPVRQPGPIARLGDTPAIVRASAPALDADGAQLRATRWDATTGTSTSAAPRRALEDVVVLELGTFFAAPFGATVLRELGARVIKVEPITGEPMRTLLPFPEVGAAKSLQGKESIGVDLTSADGLRIVHELAERADIVLQSFRAGKASTHGIDAETLRARNPKLIHHDAPGYGTDGPCGDRPAYAPTIGAGSGLVMRNIGASIPEHAGLSTKEIQSYALRLSAAGTTEYAQADGVSALTVASAMALGLYVRDRSGVAQEVLTTMLTSAAHALADDMVEHEGRAPTPVADVDLHGYGARYRLYEARDGWIYLCAPSDAEWDALVDALHDELDLAGLEDDDDELASALTKVFATKPAQHWEDLLLAHDVGCVVAHSDPPEVVLQSPQFAGAAGLLVEVTHPTFDEHPRLTAYVELSRSETVTEPGCLLGQHTDAILGELGYDAAAIASLREAGVVV